MRTTIEDILQPPPVARIAGDSIGDSREGRPIKAFRLGAGPCRVSLLGGCHADEPVGPLLLRHLVRSWGGKDLFIGKCASTDH